MSENWKEQPEVPAGEPDLDPPEILNEILAFYAPVAGYPEPELHVWLPVNMEYLEERQRYGDRPDDPSDLARRPGHPLLERMLASLYGLAGMDSHRDETGGLIRPDEAGLRAIDDAAKRAEDWIFRTRKRLSDEWAVTHPPTLTKNEKINVWQNLGEILTPDWLDERAGRLLYYAQIPLTTYEFSSFVFLLTGLPLAVFLVMFKMPLAGVCGALVGAALPFLWLRRTIRRRRNQGVYALPADLAIFIRKHALRGENDPDRV